MIQMHTPPGSQSPEKAEQMREGDRDTRDLPNEELAEEIQRVSPEGPPAHPEAGPRTIIKLIVGIALLIILAGILTAVFSGHVILGVVTAAVGLALLVLNPQIWANVFRAEERNRAVRDLKSREQRTASKQR